MEVDENLPVLAYSKREDPRDVLILPKNIEELNPDLPIGCSSLRRTLQLKKLYPHMRVEPIRGNVLTRLEKLDAGEYSALVLAAAGIKRLLLTDRIHRYFTIEEMLPAAGQGIIVIQGRKGEDYSFLEEVNDKESEVAAISERAFVKALNGGCTSPIAAFTTRDEENIMLHCMYEDGERRSFQNLAEHALELGVYAAHYRSNKVGKVWLVGAGPSDPLLLTLKGKQLLEQADVVVYDRLVGDGILAMIPQGTERIYVGKTAGDHPVPQERINEILFEEAVKGKKVVRLKGGDPFVFGRGGEELELLVANDIPFEVVPGITSAIAVSAYQGIPVTYREYCSSLHIITGHMKKDEPLDIDFEALVRTKGTLVFLMGVSSLKAICDGLLANGMNPHMPAAVLENGTKAKQRKVVSTVENLYKEAIEAEMKSPSIIVVGEVCALSDKFAWYDKLPLAGCKVVVTRPKELVSSLSQLLREKGAEVLELPSIVTQKVVNNEALSECLNKILSFQWIVLTSPTGAKYFFEELSERRVDVRRLNHLKFAVVGKATGKIVEEKGIYPDLMPDHYDAAELGQLLAQLVKPQDKILIPRAREGTAELREVLENIGTRVYDIPLYDTVYAKSEDEMSKAFDENEVDYAVFTSASTVKGFEKASPNHNYSKVKAICIGKSTKKAAEELGMMTFVSEEATIDSLVQCIEENFSKEHRRQQ
jgi:uroporphyrinogen III methyltransferase/synthase